MSSSVSRAGRYGCNWVCHIVPGFWVCMNYFQSVRIIHVVNKKAILTFESVDKIVKMAVLKENCYCVFLFHFIQMAISKRCPNQLCFAQEVVKGWSINYSQCCIAREKIPLRNNRLFNCQVLKGKRYYAWSWQKTVWRYFTLLLFLAKCLSLGEKK